MLSHSLLPNFMLRMQRAAASRHLQQHVIRPNHTSNNTTDAVHLYCRGVLQVNSSRFKDQKPFFVRPSRAMKNMEKKSRTFNDEWSPPPTGVDLFQKFVGKLPYISPLPFSPLSPSTLPLSPLSLSLLPSHLLPQNQNRESGECCEPLYTPSGVWGRATPTHFKPGESRPNADKKVRVAEWGLMSQPSQAISGDDFYSIHSQTGPQCQSTDGQDGLLAYNVSIARKVSPKR